MTDQELLEGMRSHSKKAVEEVYRKVRPGIISYVCSNRGNAEEADDLIQESLVAAYINITKPDFQLTAALNTYVQSIARNIWLKNMERYKNRYLLDNEL